MVRQILRANRDETAEHNKQLTAPTLEVVFVNVDHMRHLMQPKIKRHMVCDHFFHGSTGMVLEGAIVEILRRRGRQRETEGEMGGENHADCLEDGPWKPNTRCGLTSVNIHAIVPTDREKVFVGLRVEC